MTSTGDSGGMQLDSTALPIETARALLRFVEGAPDVCRRHQFFTLLQGQLQPLLPHTVALCGAYDRQRRELVFDVFNTVVLPAPLMLQLRRADSPLLRQLVEAWIDGQGEPLDIPLGRRPTSAAEGDVEALLEAGVQRLLVHGVSRPERVHELSSLFVLGGPAAPAGGDERRLLQLVVHGLQAAYLRVLGVEREIGASVPRPMPREELRGAPVPRVTPREVQILAWVREGKNNQEIGVALGISALTVKNHVQKILRKLGASNRAHAVALAMQFRLLGDEPRH